MAGDADARRQAVEAARAFLAEWGLLLLHDNVFPSLSRQIAGEPIRGSWWGHPKGGTIFRTMGALADEPDVSLHKLVNGKVTFVHRSLWPALMAIGMAREPWQMEGLSEAAASLLRSLDEHGRAEASGAPVRALETRLLAASEEFHTESGAHRTRLLSWDAFSEMRRQPPSDIPPPRAREELAARLAAMNDRFGASAKSPWSGRI